MVIYCYAQFGCWVGKRCEQTQDNNKHWETDFVTSSQNGEPQALYRPDGTLRWQAPKSTLWGQRQGSTEDPADPGLAFAGQCRDTESGLCYNRFRYYDPAGGCYVSPDPIGIAGGESNYGYVHNPMCWVDPFGLAGCNLNPKDIHFMQSSIKNQTGAHTVLDNAKALSNGSLKASDLPAIKVWKDPSGKIWTLDHRRLAAFKIAGLNEVPVQWATPKEIAGQMWKMTTRTEGKNIILKMGDGVKKIIGG
ncbi:hypothetical protein PEC301619_36280 [Pectobacterium carotovorum subsp. carotovorum]|nr:hypothetical protein GBN63_05260 [Pectobacterium carotovorum]GKV91646.1 hypothetical protein PEC301619_36280 [Pectobacterium carotovorum subsp. carotovorum]